MQIESFPRNYQGLILVSYQALFEFYFAKQGHECQLKRKKYAEKLQKDNKVKFSAVV